MGTHILVGCPQLLSMLVTFLHLQKRMLTLSPTMGSASRWHWTASRWHWHSLAQNFLTSMAPLISLICEVQVQQAPVSPVHMCDSPLRKKWQPTSVFLPGESHGHPTLCHTVDCSPPGSSVHGILQTGILEWVAISYSARRSNQSTLKEINPEYSLEGLMLKLKCQYFGYLM